MGIGFLSTIGRNQRILAAIVWTVTIFIILNVLPRNSDVTYADESFVPRGFPNAIVETASVPIGLLLDDERKSNLPVRKRPSYQMMWANVVVNSLCCILAIITVCAVLQIAANRKHSGHRRGRTSPTRRSPLRRAGKWGLVAVFALIAFGVAWEVACEDLSSWRYFPGMYQNTDQLVTIYSGFWSPSMELRTTIDGWRFTWKVWATWLAAVSIVAVWALPRFSAPPTSPTRDDSDAASTDADPAREAG